MSVYEWIDAYVGSDTELADVLNELEEDGWEIFQILQHTEPKTEYGNDEVGVYETVVARKKLGEL